MKTWRTWTAKELARLAELRWEGLSMPAIAVQLGRSLASVKCRVQIDGIERPSLAARRLLSRWWRAFQEPHTIAGLAEQFGVTKWAVKQAKRKLRRAGFKVPVAIRRGREDSCSTPITGVNS